MSLEHSNAIEYLRKKLRECGVEVHRCRPKSEQSWISFSQDGVIFYAKNDGEHNWLCVRQDRGPGYHGVFLNIRFTKNSIKKIENSVCIGTQYGFVFIDKKGDGL